MRLRRIGVEGGQRDRKRERRGEKSGATCLLKGLVEIRRGFNSIDIENKVESLYRSRSVELLSLPWHGAIRQSRLQPRRVKRNRGQTVTSYSLMYSRYVSEFKITVT